MPFRARCSFELPDDVFYEGQVRPTRVAKKQKKRVHATMDSGDSVLIPSRLLRHWYHEIVLMCFR
jgi:hypothetical protein